MTTPNPAAEAAREAARAGDGTFGAQEHTAPEAELNSTDTLGSTLNKLSWALASDAARDEDRMQHMRVAAFVEEARESVPGATRAVFYTEEGVDGTRLVWSHYEDDEEEQVEGADGEYPDINDFAFEDLKYASAFGFERDPDSPESGVRYLPFGSFRAPDKDRAAAQLAAAEKLDRDADGRAIRRLLDMAMDSSLDPKLVQSLSDDQLDKIREVLDKAADMVRTTVETTA